MVDCESFEELVKRSGVRRYRPGRAIDAYEIVDLVDRIREAGNEILRLRREGKLSDEHAESLLGELLAYYRQPMKTAKRVGEIIVDLKGTNR